MLMEAARQLLVQSRQTQQALMEVSQANPLSQKQPLQEK
jgi:hypothetical protein